MPSLLLVAIAALLTAVRPSVVPQTPAAQPAVERGIWVRLKGEEQPSFFPWASEVTVNRQLRRLRDAEGGELTFAPGTYSVLRGFLVPQVPDLTISGSPGTELVFKDEPRTPLTLDVVESGARTIRVDRTDDLRVGLEYQVYAADLDKTRVLEFQVESVEGDTIHLAEPAKLLAHYESIPAGSRVLLTCNFFKVLGCQRLVIQGLSMDGRERGDVRGHTLYGGVYASGLLQHARPKIHGLTVRDCTFRGLAGRGVAVYGYDEVAIENCEFHDITAQAIEIDHFSSARVAGNRIDGAEVGVMLNDCFDTLVEDNELSNCLTAVRFLRLFGEDWVNTGNVVHNNRIGPGNRRGVVFEDEIADGLSGNRVVANHFIGQGPKSRIVDPGANKVEGNTHEP